MWADNETEVDLLGFDFLVDTLFVALTEPRLLPLTVGLLGDWGSGKSSLMRITRQELLMIRDPDQLNSPYLCVEFSPWQYEDYDDVKVALMTTVLDAVGARADDDQQEQVSKLRRFARGFGRWGRRGGPSIRGARAAIVHNQQQLPGTDGLYDQRDRRGNRAEFPQHPYRPET